MTPAPNDPSDILAWRRLGARLTTSGQPTEAQLAAIKALDVTHVINLGLHTHEKALADEAGCVAALGMRYIHIPVDFDHPTEADFERFRIAMRDLAGETVHVHCIANLRVSAFLYRYDRDEADMTEQEARARMESIWRPGGVWARFIGDAAASALPHRFAGRDYAFALDNELQ
jgi:protein tyrosine phosphatase (PTP) superfamily phosphohydrolase (DUF442 family)